MISQLTDASIQACITSPPYAKQRKLYEGISESDYPGFTVEWMESLRPKLTPDASVLIVIRSHISNGQVSDYVLRTRLALREKGWIECEELIWHKPDAPPLGSTLRPRRAWENILWFSQNRQPFVNLRACGNPHSNRVGGFAGSQRFGTGGLSPIHSGQNQQLSTGVSRCSDVFQAHVGDMIKGVAHPAMYPPTLASQLIQTFSHTGDIILDPFLGGGTTAVAATRLGRRWIGIELSEPYADEASRVIVEQCGDLHPMGSLFDEETPTGV